MRLQPILLFQDCFDNLRPLAIHMNMNLRIIFSISVKKAVEILIEVAVNL